MKRKLCHPKYCESMSCVQSTILFNSLLHEKYSKLLSKELNHLKVEIEYLGYVRYEDNLSNCLGFGPSATFISLLHP